MKKQESESKRVGTFGCWLWILASSSGCAAIPVSGDRDRPQVRLSAEPVVGALGEFADVADVGYGVSTTYAHPVADVGEHALFVEGSVGLAWNQVSGTQTIPSGLPNVPPTVIEVEDDASAVHLGVGAQLQFEVPADDLHPHVSLGATYWNYDSDLGSVDAPGAYLGLGLDWSITDQWSFGLGGRMNLLAASGAVEGLGIVPVLGLSLGFRF